MPNAKVSESRLWSWLSSGARKHFRKDLHMDRLENLVLQGMPDVEGCLWGTQFWIELKCEARPARSATPIRPKFRDQQIPWLERRIRAGGNGFVLLQVGSGHTAARYLVRGDLAHLLVPGLPESEIQNIAQTPGSTSAAGLIEIAAYDP